MFDKRLLQHFDWPLLLSVLLVAAAGIVNLYSAAQASNPGLHLQQLSWVGLGVVVALMLTTVDYRVLERGAYGIFIVALVLLFAVLVTGRIAYGAQRWIALGPVRFQPSEIAKLATIIVLARWFSRDTHVGAYGLRELIAPMMLLALPVALVLPQPDLGTAGLIGLVGASIILFMGVRIRSFLLLAGTFVGAATTAWFFMLHDYQRRRVTTFLNPEADTLGAGYHAFQSLIAVGSGGLSGKGFMNGTQTQLSFLPEQHTDFVFSVAAEEWGFLGCTVVLGLYVLLFLLALRVAAGCRDKFGSLLAVGITAMLAWQMFINIGMVIGLLPVVGVPLPLMSYGGSSALTTFVGVGLLLNISMRRFLF